MSVLVTLLIMISVPILVQPYGIDSVRKAIKMVQSRPATRTLQSERSEPLDLENSELAKEHHGYRNGPSDHRTSTNVQYKYFQINPNHRGFVVDKRPKPVKTSKPVVILIDTRLHQKAPSNPMEVANMLNFDTEEDNTGLEILDKSQEDNIRQNLGFRRKQFQLKSKFRDREDLYSSESSTSSDDDVSATFEFEKNPGNPYTVKHNKYKQNWMWNHFMDGDHMNINPYGPKLYNGGPTGRDIFFNRKWWYFNQDDYKPLG